MELWPLPVVSPSRTAFIRAVIGFTGRWNGLYIRGRCSGGERIEGGRFVYVDVVVFCECDKLTNKSSAYCIHQIKRNKYNCCVVFDLCES